MFKQYVTFSYLWIFFALTIFPASAQVGGLDSLRQSGKAFSYVAQRVSPSVVFIQVESSQESSLQDRFFNPFNDDFFRRFFGEGFPGVPRQDSPESQPRTVNQGSGFVFSIDNGLLSDKVYILTNNHLVEGAENIHVTFQDGREFEADITGTDPQSDIAVIEIMASNVPFLLFGDSSMLEVGEWVAAIGNPFGLNHTLTVGVVSAKDRTGLGINDYEDFIQTDAAINPGNSGGPLVNLDGEVIGINSAIFTRSGGYMGVGFAIPSNLVKTIAVQLIDSGEVIRGYLGIVIQPLTADLAQSFGLEQTRGVLIAQISENSPAQQAGLKQGDIITAFQNQPVTDVGDFRNRVSLTTPGSRAQLTVIRDGRRRNIEVSIGRLNEEQRVSQDSTRSIDELGLTVQALSPQLAEQFNARAGEGVVVTQVAPGSIAAMAGIQRGSIILEVNRIPVNTVAMFHQAIEDSRKESQVLLLIRTIRGQRYVALKWDR